MHVVLCRSGSVGTGSSDFKSLMSKDCLVHSLHSAGALLETKDFNGGTALNRAAKSGFSVLTMRQIEQFPESQDTLCGTV